MFKLFKKNFKTRRIINKSGLFDQNYYLTQNPDVKKYDGDPLEHYILYGEKEGRKPNAFFNPEWYEKSNKNIAHLTSSLLVHYILKGERNGFKPSYAFDPYWYLQNYKDLTSTTWKQGPLSHFLKIGLSEERYPSKEILNDSVNAGLCIKDYYRQYKFNETRPKEDLKNFTKKSKNSFETIILDVKVAIVIHASHLEMMPEVLKYLSNITLKHKLFFTTSHSNEKLLRTIIDTYGLQDYEIQSYQNKGNDIHPFLDILARLKKENFELVCKVHTLKIFTNLEKHEKDIDDLWFKLLINPILGSKEIIYEVIRTFKATDSIGMLGSADLYKSSQSLMHENEVIVTSILNSLDSNFDPAADWGFFAGTMFWAKLDIFDPLIKNKEINALFLGENEIKSEQKTSASNSLEMLFGALPEISNKKTALSFATNIERTEYKVISKNIEHTKPSSLSVDMTLQNEFEILNNYQLLKNNSEFNLPYYLNNNPRCIALKTDPILDFLRYGVYQNQAPNPLFSPFAYWSLHPDTLLKKINPLIHSIEQKQVGFLAEKNISDAIDYIAKSKLFNKKAYLHANPDVARVKMNPVIHYCTYGWKEERELGTEFDALWYKSEYLLGFLSPVNPLLHYILIGKKKGYLTKPSFKNKQLNKYILPKKPNRICLFAAYDTDGLVDESVLLFIKELSRHSDVYFLSDSKLQKGELKKVKAYAKNAWAIRHGEYDFGSYKRLAKYLVGWDKINTYDELLLVNDSSYLIKPLDDTFTKMNSKDCSWWGMQATKGLFATKNQKSNKFKNKIPLQQVKNSYLEKYEEDKFYDFHIGSYFLAFRKPILEKSELKNILNNVKRERNKKNIITKYEIGLTRKLINSGYDFSTVIDYLYPFHPIYTNNIYDLIEEGYPLFKRFLLTENHYHVPQLWRWKKNLLKILPDLDIKPIEDNLYRIADAGKLYNNLNIKNREQKILSHKKFIKQDNINQTDMNIWAFPVCAFDHTFSGNERAVFEEVKDNPEITKVILFRSKHIRVDGTNTIIIPLQSYEGQQLLMKSGVILIKHTPITNVIYPLDSKKHKFINLWHGIPLKRIGVASLDFQDRIAKITAVHAQFHSAISSSSIDRLAMTAAFAPLTYNDIWVTGLPRNDFILRPKELLPEDFGNELIELESKLSERKFILFVPTFRNDQGNAYYKFSKNEIESLNNYLETNNIILGLREHMADKANSYSSDLVGGNIINVGSNIFPNIEILYRKADLLITDYSSCFIDFMLTGKPMISFAYDYEHYMNKERGFFYDMEFVFPGPICKDYQSLLLSIVETMNQVDKEPSENYLSKRKIFFDYIDDKNSSRVVKEINKIPT